MDPLTMEDLMASYAAAFSEEHVHRQRALRFRGQPGHFYFLTRAPSYADLAATTRLSGNAEVSLLRINSTYIVSIGSRSHATTRMLVPESTEGVERFEWIAHTHPLDQANDEQSIAHGATEQDRRSLERISRRFGQTRSVVVVCRGGRVVSTPEFRIGE